MYKLKVLFIENSNLIAKNRLVKMIEQTIITNNLTFNIPVPTGYSIVSITQILDDLIINENEKNIPKN